LGDEPRPIAGFGERGAPPVDDERSPQEQFIHFTPNVPPETASPDAASAPAESRRARAEAAPAAEPMTFRLPPAALGRWGRGSGEHDEPAGRGGAPAAASRRGAPARIVAPRTPVPPAAGGAARAAAVGRNPRNAPAPARPVASTDAPPASRQESRDTRSGYQDEWLNTARRAGTPLDLTLLNGTMLGGRLVNFDTYSLILEAENETLLVFKHAICAVRPQRPAPPT